jgi:carotenoid cleavage dioxygenase-like enzyme
MTTPFPHTPDFTGPLYTPSRFEGEVFDLEVVGQIPTELNGVFYQVAPDPAYPPMLGDDIFFNGDGAVTAFRFAGGHVDLQRRYVMTDRLAAQRAARKSLFGLYRNPFTDDESVRDLSPSTANTNIVPFAGRLLALKEDSLPYLVDPETLETMGEWDFGGQIGRTPFTAHPKIDSRSGALCAMGYEAKGLGTRDIVYYEFDAAGKKLREIWLEAPYAGMVHDFAVTDNWIIFPVLPMTADADRMARGGRHFEWQPNLDYQFGVLSRTSDAQGVRWFRGPNCFQAHVLNAFEADGKLILDMPSASGNVFTFFPEADGSVPDPQSLRSELTRWTIDLAAESDEAVPSTLFAQPCEFPRCDPRYAGQAYRHAFVLALDPTLPFQHEALGPWPFQFFNQLAHVDTQGGGFETWFPGDAECFQEPTFVPRSQDAAEGDGYVLVLVNHLLTHTTELVILDALKVADGPVARVKLPVRLRMSLHGNWLDAGPSA